MSKRDHLQIVDLEFQLAQQKVDEQKAGFDGGGGGGYDGAMDERVKKLEEFAGEARTELRQIDVRLTKIESRLEHMATKADLTEAMNSQVKWIVGTALGLGVAGITVMTFVLNNAVPKALQPVPAAQAPIVIYAPPQATPPEPNATAR